MIFAVLPHLPKHLLIGLIKYQMVNSQAGKDRQASREEEKLGRKNQKGRDLPARHGGNWTLVTEER